MKSIEDFIEHQSYALVRDFASGGFCLSGISGDNLQRQVAYHGWCVESLSRCRSSNAFVVRKSPERKPECWVKWNYKNYRHAFKIFLKEYFPEYYSELDNDTHVDHMEPRLRFVNCLKSHDKYYLRLHLVPGRINSGFGAGYEKNFYQNEGLKSPQEAIHVSWLAYIKTVGGVLPGRNAGEKAWDTWARACAKQFSALTGESEAYSYAGFLCGLRLGYTGYWAGKPGEVDMNYLVQTYDQKQADCVFGSPASD